MELPISSSEGEVGKKLEGLKNKLCFTSAQGQTLP